jgi:hypothetical protein
MAVKSVSGTRRTLYLDKGAAGLYLTSERTRFYLPRAQYFREGSRRLFKVLPTWFKSEAEARAAAKAQGFRVVRRKA